MSNQLNFDTPLPPPLPMWRFTVEQYHQLGELGVLTPEDQVELLEGWIVQKMNQRPIHGFIVRYLNDLFTQALPDGWLCQCQLPITTERSEPEPDLAIIKGLHTDFKESPPRGLDCRLIVEVADTSLDRDRAKVDIYRTSGVGEYWVVNVAQRTLERYAFVTDSNQAVCELYDASEAIMLQLDTTQIRLELSRIFT